MVYERAYWSHWSHVCEGGKRVRSTGIGKSILGSIAIVLLLQRRFAEGSL